MAAAIQPYHASDLNKTPTYLPSSTEDQHDAFDESFTSANNSMPRSHLNTAKFDEATYAPLFEFSPKMSPASFSQAHAEVARGAALPSSATWDGTAHEKGLQYPEFASHYPIPSPPMSAKYAPNPWQYHRLQPGSLHNVLDQHLSTDTRAQYGQVTPPDDGSPVGVVAGQDQQQEEQPGRRMKNNKRKRTQSNVSPQLNSKRLRKTSARSKQSQSFANSKNTEEDNKRSKFLERNRVAASKCRQKKKEWMSELEARARDLQNSKNHLAMMVSSLRDEVLFLKGELLKHNGCGCHQIRDYLGKEAESITYAKQNNNHQQAMSDVASHRSDLSHSPSMSLASRRESSQFGDYDRRGVSIKTEEDKLEALLASQLVQDTSERGIADRVSC
ncbi:hypothetical protein MMC20_003207 [Loxospora ochrophaea]|nr:hypothetical protein [Loxospora ochrophaea]